MLVPAEEAPQIPAHAPGADAGGAPPPGFGGGGGAFWEYQAELARCDPAALPPERRRELLELGFPDDGYDYLKHMKEAGAGFRAVAAARKPEAALDVRTVEALGLELPAAAPGAAGADLLEIHSATREAKSGVTKAAREVIRELERAARELPPGVRPEAGGEGGEEEEGLLRGSPAARRGAVEEGDLEDDFVNLATDATAGDNYAEAAGIGALEERREGPDGLAAMAMLRAAAGYSSEEEEDDDRRGAEGGGQRQQQQQQRLLDEQFANLELEYGEDDLGDLEETQAGETRMPGARPFEDATLGSMFDEFLEAQSRRGQAYEPEFARPREAGGGSADVGAAAAPSCAGARGEAAAPEEDKAHARSIIAQMRETPEEEDDRPLPRSLTLQPPLREEWDCESVLSLRSNLDNHPGTIETPSSRRRRERAARPEGEGGDEPGVLRDGIRLSHRHGIAVDFLERGAGGQPREERGRFGEGAGKARERAETAEEKRARKAAVKAAQREARAAKKELKTLFKQGAQKQAAQGPRGPSVVPM